MTFTIQNQIKILKNKKKERNWWHDKWMEFDCLWSARGMSSGPKMNKRHKHMTGAEDNFAYEWVEKGDEWNSTVASVSSGGMPYRNTQGASQRSEVTTDF